MRPKAFLLTLSMIVVTFILSNVSVNAYGGATGIRVFHALVDVEAVDI